MNTHLVGRRKVGERDTNTNFLCCPLRRRMRGKGAEEKERGRKNGGEQRRGKREE